MVKTYFNYEPKMAFGGISTTLLGDYSTFSY